MSLIAKRTITTSAVMFLMLGCLSLLPLALLAQTDAGAVNHAAAVALASPEETPWWKRVDEIQGLLLKWIAMLTVVIGALAPFIANLMAKYSEIKAKLAANDERHMELQKQLTTVALAAPAPNAPNPPNPPNPPNAPNEPNQPNRASSVVGKLNSDP